MKTERKITKHGWRISLGSFLLDEDRETLFEGMNDPEVSEYIGDRGPFTQTDIEKRILEWEQESIGGNRISFAVIENETGKIIGVARLRRLKIVDGKGMITIFIANPNFRNKGYGTEAGLLTMHYGFTVLGLRKIKGSVFAYNTRSLAAVKKMGIVSDEGVMREDRFWNGKYWDMYNFAAFKDEWLANFWEPYIAKHGTPN